ncbi:uncharacterized protein B0J16DRAFT_375391 [Fusarium flagelliforme]|uniref:uncharacterized protein n=1 Tax=Fusarium flagelliforme TaxID=2675880 RepID=UPI001E8DF930|nr:uncharacterized protein B0J16DRAFT_375391 [Fusarium flagelliforme]KAH7174565.1 hypothetical protein B0J16DRAFT_375391 [Fusarium flagelliforme]
MEWNTGYDSKVVCTVAFGGLIEGDDEETASPRGITLRRIIQVTQVKCLRGSVYTDETPGKDIDPGKYGNAWPQLSQSINHKLSEIDLAELTIVGINLPRMRLLDRVPNCQRRLAPGMAMLIKLIASSKDRIDRGVVQHRFLFYGRGQNSLRERRTVERRWYERRRIRGGRSRDLDSVAMTGRRDEVEFVSVWPEKGVVTSQRTCRWVE